MEVQHNSHSQLMEFLPLEVMPIVLEKSIYYFIIQSYDSRRSIVENLMSVNKDWLNLMCQHKRTMKLVVTAFDKAKRNIRTIDVRPRIKTLDVSQLDRILAKFHSCQLLEDRDWPSRHCFLKIGNKIESILNGYTIKTPKTKLLKILPISDDIPSNDMMKKRIIENIEEEIKKAIEEFMTMVRRRQNEVKANLVILEDVVMKISSENGISNLEKSVRILTEANESLTKDLNKWEIESNLQKVLVAKLSDENKQLRIKNTQLKADNELLKREIAELNAKQETISENSATEKTPKDMSAAIVSYIRGYPIDIFVVEIEEKYLCTECGLILKNPIQSFCGHRFCKDCFDQMMSHGAGKAVCKRCSEENGETSGVLEASMTFPDNAIRRELNSMAAVCSFKNCSWSGSFKQYEDHFGKCEWSPVKCSCGEETTKNQFDGHTCRKAAGSSGHPCKYKCGKPVLDSDLFQHIQKFIPEHLEAIFVRLTKVISVIGNVDHQRGIPLSDQLLVFEETINSLNDRIQAFSGSTNQSKSSRSIETSRNPADTSEVEQLYSNDFVQANSSESLKYCENILALLNREAEQSSIQMIKLENSTNSQRRKFDDFDDKVKTIHRILALKDVCAVDFDKRLTDLEQTSYDGSFLWRVADFQRKRQDAISGRATSIYSPPFYTSKTGYKMCARLYLNGDGMGKGTHVSLFFVVMRGKYDALLKWPFRQKVTLMFLEQSGKEHVVDAFRPDPTSSSFKRPTTEMNIASGCPLFLALTQFSNTATAFVKDDTAFIKISVSVNDI